MSAFKRLFRRFILGAIAAVVLSLPVQAAEGYTFGIVPQFEARKLASIWEPIIAELESRTGYDFQIMGSPRIPEFEQAFMRGEFDFAYMNPYHSVMAMDGQGYRPLVRDGGRQLFGVLAVRKDSPHQSVADLEGQTIAFPAPNALGASLMMRAELTRRHGVSFSPNYVSTHSSAYLNVVLGEAAAAGGVMATFKAQDPQIRENLRILYETTKVAPHPIVAHPRVPDEVAERVRRTILEMAATQAGREMLARVPIRKAVEASVEDYLPLRELGLEEFIVRN